MENNVSQAILQSSDVYSSSDSGGYFSNMNWTTWLLIILILAFFGFNVFVYLAQGTQTIADIFGPIVKTVFGTTVAVAGETVDVAAEGAKQVVGKTADVLDTGLTAVQNITPNVAQSRVKGQAIQPQQDQGDQDHFHQALNSSQSQSNDYQAHEASSSIHSAGKVGWCYVGNDRGFRSCAEVGVDDSCMSGDIYPSHEICVNPNLRR